jgi:2,3-bisphosphoglycerate-independent phosphoglycerate mutase
MMAYNVMTKNEGASFTDALEYIESEKLQGRNDEFIIPSFNSNLNVKINDNDVVIFANFRPDRARQLSHLFIGSDVYEFNDVERKQNLFFASMMEYANINTKVIFQPEPMVDLLGETISKAGLKQMRAAETEKYPHVTFFLDGGKEIDHEGQIKILANSPKVATYDLQPEMSAPELTDKILENIENVDVAIINYANPDMVGHTGSIEATKKAVETVDYQASRIFEKVTELGGVMMVTADHGNAEQMLDENGEP